MILAPNDTVKTQLKSRIVSKGQQFKQFAEEENVEGRRRSPQLFKINIKVISNLIHNCYNSPPPPPLTKPYKRRRVGGGKRMYGEVWGGVGGGRRSKSPKVQGFQVPGVPRSQGSRHLKLTFKYELDSEEGPSCLVLPYNISSYKPPFGSGITS